MFIKDLYAISPQKTIDDSFEKGDFQIHTSGKMEAIEPNYIEFIAPGQLRRMGKAVRMGIGAGLPLINRNPALQGIIIGTANGGLEDCVKFLNQIVEYEEGVLTPTNFVQSTPNAVAGQLALISGNRGYNSTHVNGSLAFENALLDAILVLESKKQPADLIVGSVEAISSYNYNIEKLQGNYKKEIVSNEELLNSNTPGSLCGEGSTMFIVSNDSTKALAEIVDVAQISFPTEDELYSVVKTLLAKNKIEIADIDLLIQGFNGDNRTEHWYSNLNKHFTNSKIVSFKELCGEYKTASAFGLYFTTKLLNNQLSTHQQLKTISPNYALIHNHFDGKKHGFILVKKSNNTSA